MDYWLKLQQHRLALQQKRAVASAASNSSSKAVAGPGVLKLPSVDVPFAMVVKPNIPQVLESHLLLNKLSYPHVYDSVEGCDIRTALG
jgi:hypothetical protein